ncbi:DoxX family membrane protein [Maribacter algicola]|uniref:DoxX family membrane protein n=1 Tax=Maribacter algicola TaxID=2498892 RepID=A0A3R8WDR5_9FLAO|nr:DoxX family membrane protein [Maribacter algicola]RRQ48106.1 DoxX family membrane protein [Maribacter algicola]
MEYYFKIIIRPFEVSGHLPNLILLVPRILTGYSLSFIYAPNKFGTPWTPDSMDLSWFEVSKEFVNHIAYQGYPFDVMPNLFAWSIGFMEAVGGLLLILGLNTRVTSFFVFLTMAMGIFVRKWDGSWDILPVFIFFCVSFFYMGFGAGKFSLDYYIAKRYVN